MITDKNNIIKRGLMVTKADMSDESSYAKTAYFIKTKYPCQNVASLRMTKQEKMIAEILKHITEKKCTKSSL
jgi:hypothetical protein